MTENKEALDQIKEAMDQVELSRDNVDVKRQAKVDWHLDVALDHLRDAKKEVKSEVE